MQHGTVTGAGMGCLGWDAWDGGIDMNLGRLIYDTLFQINKGSVATSLDMSRTIACALSAVCCCTISVNMACARLASGLLASLQPCRKTLAASGDVMTIQSKEASLR